MKTPDSDQFFARHVGRGVYLHMSCQGVTGNAAYAWKGTATQFNNLVELYPQFAEFQLFEAD